MEPGSGGSVRFHAPMGAPVDKPDLVLRVARRTLVQAALRCSRGEIALAIDRVALALARNAGVDGEADMAPWRRKAVLETENDVSSTKWTLLHECCWFRKNPAGVPPEDMWLGSVVHLLSVAAGDDDDCAEWINREAPATSATALHELMRGGERDADEYTLAAVAAMLASGADARSTNGPGKTARDLYRHRDSPTHNTAVDTLLRTAEEMGSGPAAVREMLCRAPSTLEAAPGWSVVASLPAVQACAYVHARVLIAEWAQRRASRRKLQGAAAGGAGSALMADGAWLRVWGNAPRACLAEVLLQLSRRVP